MSLIEALNGPLHIRPSTAGSRSGSLRRNRSMRGSRTSFSSRDNEEPPPVLKTLAKSYTSLYSTNTSEVGLPVETTCEGEDGFNMVHPLSVSVSHTSKEKINRRRSQSPLATNDNNVKILDPSETKSLLEVSVNSEVEAGDNSADLPTDTEHYYTPEAVCSESSGTKLCSRSTLLAEAGPALNCPTTQQSELVVSGAACDVTRSLPGTPQSRSDRDSLSSSSSTKLLLPARDDGNTAESQA